MIRRYGDPVRADIRYGLRPGAYGVLLHGADILLTWQGDPHHEFQLPGGGIDPGEGPIQALHREVHEETGWRITRPCRMGAFRRFTWMPEYQRWAEKIAHVYRATPTRRDGPASEPGHEPVWVPLAQAPALLANPGDAAFVASLL
ncbi:MAG: 8-oxo-dGTP diphosphatase [Rhodobacteraceae bacterium HLUCCA08]|nr:MAG: 8-oxo-dGTP diphosphatase [Rhodobacteraceae bacterium HLUCCA08]